MLNNIDLAEIREKVETGITKQDLVSYMSHSLNLPKPVLALAYIRVMKSTDAEIRDYTIQALDLLEFMQAGETDKVNSMLAELGLPPELGKVIMSYAGKFGNSQDKK
jgi:hypothetical protein